MTEVTEDWLLNEQVRIFQPQKGYRAGLDAILLAASLSEKPGQHVLDMGCGAGGALFPAAWRLTDTHFTGLELDEDIIPLTEKGVSANGFGTRVKLMPADVSSLPVELENSFDQTMSNPPYFEPGRITDPSQGRQNAYLAHIPLKDWLKAMLFVTKPKGRITLIHRAGELGEILAYLTSRAGQIEILPKRAGRTGQTRHRDGS